MVTDPDTPLQETRQWLETVVIDLNLCPFAKRELVTERVRFSLSHAVDEVQLLQALEFELQLLFDDDSVETTLLVHPDVLTGFSDYNQFLDLADKLLVRTNLEGVFQIASFHPDYQFAGTHPDDAENFTNRSPYPTLHVLREASLSRAIAGYPDIELVPDRNIEKMNALSAEQLKTLFRR